MMQKKILITGSTDGIGLETAKLLVSQGHYVLLHGRNPSKLEQAKMKLSEITGTEKVESYLADLSNLNEVKTLAQELVEKHDKLDVLINNAGVYKTSNPIMQDGMDVRFVVNTFAPYLLTQNLLSLFNESGRVINLSSAAQSPVNIEAMVGNKKLTDLEAYAQSKLAITMWSRHMAQLIEDKGPAVIAVNPGSLLATKMVREGFGMAGKDIIIGAQVLARAALSDEFKSATGKYFDNDTGQFAAAHHDALNPQKIQEVVNVIKKICEAV